MFPALQQQAPAERRKINVHTDLQEFKDRASSLLRNLTEAIRGCVPGFTNVNKKPIKRCFVKGRHAARRNYTSFLWRQEYCNGGKRDWSCSQITEREEDLGDVRRAPFSDGSRINNANQSTLIPTVQNNPLCKSYSGSARHQQSTRVTKWERNRSGATRVVGVGWWGRFNSVRGRRSTDGRFNLKGTLRRRLHVNRRLTTTMMTGECDDGDGCGGRDGGSEGGMWW